MKLLKAISLFVLVFGLGLFVVSCNGGETNNNNNNNNNNDHQEEMMDEDHEHEDDDDMMEASASHGEGEEYTSAYVCPMHCEGSGSEEAGKCPVCGMNYVPLAEHTENGHTH